MDSKGTMVKNTKLALAIDVLQATLNKGGLLFVFLCYNPTSPRIGRSSSRSNAMVQKQLKYDVPESADMGTRGAISFDLQRRIEKTVAKKPLSPSRLRQIDDQWGRPVYIGLLSEYHKYIHVGSTMVDDVVIHIFQKTS